MYELMKYIYNFFPASFYTDNLIKINTLSHIPYTDRERERERERERKREFEGGM